jgi:hypothetical protein
MCFTVRRPAVKIKRSENTKNGSYQHLNTPASALTGLKIIAAIEEPEVIAKILMHLGLPARSPPRTPARRPALFQAA